MTILVDRYIEQLEKELERDDLTDDDKASIVRELRDVERDMAEEQNWRDEGAERGWA